MLEEEKKITPVVQHEHLRCPSLKTQVTPIFPQVPNVFWSDPAKPEIKSSPQNTLLSRGASFRTNKAVSQFTSKASSTNTIEENVQPKSVCHGTPELFSRPITKIVPPAVDLKNSAQKSKFPAPVPVPLKARARVPPIAVAKTQKSMKDNLEFDNLYLQQELRAGAQSIWVYLQTRTQ